MYCVKCGVELADSERKCPLCGTPVYFPELPENPQRPYPPYAKVRETRGTRGMYFLITMAFVIAAVITVLCDFNVNRSLNWADYVIGGLLVTYIALVLPGWFRRPSPAIFVPCDFLAIALYLAYVNLRTSGDWFLSFAMPTVAFVALIVCSIVILSYYIRAGYLYIWGGALLATAVLFPTMEALMNMTFGLGNALLWSPYPAAAFFLLGVAVMVIAIVRPFRESLYKIFSI